MPRGARIDAPGLIHHVTFRGIERRLIFVDDADRMALLLRLDRLALTIWFRILAWALMSNHVHLLMSTQRGELARFMARLETSYALYFNRRHGRAGHLFQNRYWSKPVDDGLDALVAYVHLNPVRAGLTTEGLLSEYPWCGHGTLTGARQPRRFERDPSHVSAAPALAAIIQQECAAAGLSCAAVVGGARSHAIAAVRRRIVFRAVAEAGIAPREIAESLGIARSTVSGIVSAGG
jgi:REP element-mobilizing transposase RayT